MGEWDSKTRQKGARSWVLPVRPYSSQACSATLLKKIDDQDCCADNPRENTRPELDDETTAGEQVNRPPDTRFAHGHLPSKPPSKPVSTQNHLTF